MLSYRHIRSFVRHGLGQRNGDAIVTLHITYLFMNTLLPSIQLQLSFEPIRTSFEHIAAEFRTFVLKENRQVTTEKIKVGIHILSQ
jgi:hypothetical protein